MKIKSIVVGLIILLSMNLYSKDKAKILVLFHSETGGTYKLAQAMVEAIDENPSAEAILKQVKPSNHQLFKDVPVAEIDELGKYDGIAFGSPVYFGNMSGAMRTFLDGGIGLYQRNALAGIPATVFMSAGSGDAREGAILSFWSTLATQGMMIVPAAKGASLEINKSIPQGNTVFGITSLAGMPGSERPSSSEKALAKSQGVLLAQVAVALKDSIKHPTKKDTTQSPSNKVEARLKSLQITLPSVPAPAGNYTPYKRVGNLVYINQVALKGGKILYPGLIGKEIEEEQVKEATRQTMLNVIAVLKEATNGNLDNVKQCVQLTGMFYTPPGYTNHAGLMNAASDLAVDVFGEKGKHARATFGASSLPLNSSVEIQAIFEIE